MLYVKKYLNEATLCGKAERYLLLFKKIYKNVKKLYHAKIEGLLFFRYV